MMDKVLLEIEKILPQMDVGDSISLIACLVSVVGAIISFIMYRLAKKEYKLQMQQYKDGLANFDFEIVECYLKDDKENDKIQYWFNMLILNLSDKQTSIIEYSLTLKCLDGLSYKPEYFKDGSNQFPDIKYLDISQNIDAHNSINGWCLFEIPRITYNEIEIESYMINLKDIHHKESTKDIVYIHEEIINYEIQARKI